MDELINEVICMHCFYACSNQKVVTCKSKSQIPNISIQSFLIYSAITAYSFLDKVLHKRAFTKLLPTTILQRYQDLSKFFYQILIVKAAEKLGKSHSCIGTDYQIEKWIP